VLNVTIPLDAMFTHAVRQDMLGGIAVLTTTMPGATARTITAVPYYAWANRGRGEMVTWVPLK